MLYNELRPEKLDELVGQEVVKKTLGEALRSDNVPHSMLFVGVRGTGKTTTARIVGRAVNCLEPVNGEPCGCCKNCIEIMNEASFDVQEMDAAANRGVDDMNRLLESVHTVPLMKKKVFIIDEVHMLTKEASNRLLKVLEEPPLNVHFILCTTELRKVLPTIRSRCALFNFKAIDEITIATELSKVCDMKGISYDLSALYVLARAAKGSMRDALSLLEPLLDKKENLSTEIVNDMLGLMDDTTVLKFINAVIVKKEVPLIQEFLNDMVETGRGIDMIMDAFLSTLIDILAIKLAAGNTDSIANTAQYKEELLKMSEFIDIDDIIHLIEGLKKVRNNIAKDNNPKIGLLCEILSYVHQEQKKDEVAELRQEIANLKLILQNTSNMATVAEKQTSLHNPEPAEKGISPTHPQEQDENLAYFSYLEGMAQETNETVEPDIKPVVSNNTMDSKNSYEDIMNSMWNTTNNIVQPENCNDNSFTPIAKGETTPFDTVDTEDNYVEQQKKDEVENNVAADMNNLSSDMMEVFRNSGLTLDEPVYISSEKANNDKVLSTTEEKEIVSSKMVEKEGAEKATAEHEEPVETVDTDNASDTVSLGNMSSFLNGSFGTNSFFNFFKH